MGHPLDLRIKTLDCGTLEPLYSRHCCDSVCTVIRGVRLVGKSLGVCSAWCELILALASLRRRLPRGSAANTRCCFCSEPHDVCGCVCFMVKFCHFWFCVELMLLGWCMMPTLPQTWRFSQLEISMVYRYDKYERFYCTFHAGFLLVGGFWK